mmetsp:Transcript_42619/g.129393  ORF Transcript_42619/g.129393 Transcript_42619/m.129393 type:complete len:200 (-) Transcript_42619:514-1113(-)
MLPIFDTCCSTHPPPSTIPDRPTPPQTSSIVRRSVPRHPTPVGSFFGIPRMLRTTLPIRRSPLDGTYRPRVSRRARPVGPGACPSVGDGPDVGPNRSRRDPRPRGAGSPYDVDRSGGTGPDLRCRLRGRGRRRRPGPRGRWRRRPFWWRRRGNPPPFRRHGRHLGRPFRCPCHHPCRPHCRCPHRRADPRDRPHRTPRA